MSGIYANIWGILMVNVTIYIYSIHGSYGLDSTAIGFAPTNIMRSDHKLSNDFSATPPGMDGL